MDNTWDFSLTVSVNSERMSICITQLSFVNDEEQILNFYGDAFELLGFDVFEDYFINPIRLSIVFKAAERAFDKVDQNVQINHI